MTRTRYDARGHYDGETVTGYDAAGMSQAERDRAKAEALHALAKTTRGRIIEMLSMLFAATKSRPGADVDRAAMLTVYANELQDCAEMAISEACRKMARTQTFFPSLAEILTEVVTWEGNYRLALKSLEPVPQALPRQSTGGFRVASLGAKNSVLRDLGQDEYDRRILEIRAARARGENIALWIVREDLSLTDKGREQAREAVG